MVWRCAWWAMVAATLMVAQAASASPLFPNIVVMPAPLKPYVDEILKGAGESHTLLNAGQDAHDFALTPSQAALLEEADIVIVPSLDMSVFLKRRLAKQPKTLVIELTQLEGAEPLPYASENPWLEHLKAASVPTTSDAHAGHDHTEHAHEHEETALDPHLWLDPERMAAIAPPLAEMMGARLSEQKSLMQANARQLASHLRREVLPAMRLILKNPPREAPISGRPTVPFLTYHAAYQYFLNRFGLTHHGELTSLDKKKGAKSTVGMLKEAEKLHVRCLIVEHNDSMVKRVATLSDARIISISPEQLPEHRDINTPDWVANDYDRFLNATAQAFAGCL